MPENHIQARHFMASRMPEQEEMVQFGLFLLYSEVENGPQTCPLIYLLSMDTFYFNILLLSRMSYPCERIIIVITSVIKKLKISKGE